MNAELQFNLKEITFIDFIKINMEKLFLNNFYVYSPIWLKYLE